MRQAAGRPVRRGGEWEGARQTGAREPAKWLRSDAAQIASGPMETRWRQETREAERRRHGTERRWRRKGDGGETETEEYQMSRSRKTARRRADIDSQEGDSGLKECAGAVIQKYWNGREQTEGHHRPVSSVVSLSPR